MNLKASIIGMTTLALALTTAGTATADSEIKLGSLLDTSGIFNAYGKPMDMAASLAVEEINEQGGLLGRRINKVPYDTQSNMALYTKYAQQLIRQDKADVVVGGILSASREAIRPLLTRSNTPYVYTPLYEGGVCDYNTLMVGTTPAQQAEVLIPFAMKKFGKKAYVLAADYNYGQNMAKWFQKYLADNGGQVVSVDFFPLEVSDFNSTIAKIQSEKPDFILSALVGGAHLSFYRQWAAAGMKEKIPMASTTLGVGNEHIVLTPEEGNGILVAYNYSPQLDNDANAHFLSSWEKRFGSTKDINGLAVSHYQGIMLWADAVRKADSLKTADLRKAMKQGVSMVGPSGLVTVDSATQHTSHDVHVMEVNNQKLQILQSFPQQPPRDTQGVCDLHENPTSSKQHEIKL